MAENQSNSEQDRPSEVKFADYAKAGQMAYIFDQADPQLSHGIVLNPEHLERLATWLCHEGLCTTHDSSMRKTQRDVNGGFCVECGNNAAWMLLECPFI